MTQRIFAIDWGVATGDFTAGVFVTKEKDGTYRMAEGQRGAPKWPAAPRSIFLWRAYLATSEEPEVATAAAQLRAAIARRASTGAAFAKLRRRVERVLRRQIAEAEAERAFADSI